MSNSRKESFIKLFSINNNLSVEKQLDVSKQQFKCDLMNYLLNSITSEDEMKSMFDVFQFTDIETNYRSISKSYFIKYKNESSHSKISKKYVLSRLIRSITNDEKLDCLYKLKDQNLIVFFIDDEIDILERGVN